MTDNPSLLIVGPGAMGCLHAALLREAGCEVMLLDHRAERAEEINARGVRLTFPDGEERTVRVACSAEPGALSPADLLIVFTKAYDTAEAMRWARPVVGVGTTVLTLQNGLGNWEAIEAELTGTGGTEVPPLQLHVLAGATSSGATMTGVGEVRVAAIGEAVLGSPRGASQKAEVVAALLTGAGLPAKVTDDVEAALWRKAIINAAINPLGALTRRRNGELLEPAALRTLLGKVAREAHAAALGAGIALGELDPVAAAEEVCRKTATNQCSMLQDVLAGRRTEIEQINGEIARRGKAVGVAVELNEALVGLVGGIAAGEER